MDAKWQKGVHQLGGIMLAKSQRGLGVLLLMIASGMVSGAPLTYSESVSGDLHGQSVGMLDIGTNTVQGTFCFTAVNGDCPPALKHFEIDTFAFELPSESVLQSITFNYSSFPVPIENFSDASITFELDSGDLVLATSETIDLLTSNDLAMFGSALPLTASGSYFIGVSGAEFGGGPPLYLTADYTWTLSVAAAPIPEPETYAMLLAGLGLMGLVARRRKQAS